MTVFALFSRIVGTCILPHPTHPYSDFTGDSGERIARRESLRKKPRTKMVREPTQNHGHGTNRRPRRGGRQPDVDAVVMEEEEVPIANFKDMSRKDWRAVRKLDPYHFPERTCDGDNRFWTRTQFKIWNEFYMTLAEKVVKPRICDEEYFDKYKNNSLKHIYATLENMNILKLAIVYQSYCPKLISQFYCTVFFHNDSVRTMT